MLIKKGVIPGKRKKERWFFVFVLLFLLEVTILSILRTLSYFIPKKKKKKNSELLAPDGIFLLVDLTFINLGAFF